MESLYFLSWAKWQQASVGETWSRKEFGFHVSFDGICTLSTRMLASVSRVNDFGTGQSLYSSGGAVLESTE